MAPSSAQRRLDGASLTALLKDAQEDASRHSLSLCSAGITPILAVQVADFLETNRSVVELDLSGNAIGSHGARCIAASLQKNPVVKHLTVADCGLRSDVVAAFVECFRAQATAGGDGGRLLLSSNQIDDDAADALGALVAATASTQLPTEAVALDLRNNCLADDAMRTMACAMQQNHTLTALQIDGNQDEEATVAKKQITFCLARNQRELERGALLQRVDAIRQSQLTLFDWEIQHIELSIEDARLLASALLSNRSLLSLKLRDNALPSEGTRLIVHALASHPSIRALTIHDNAVGDGGFVALNRLLRSSATLTKLAVTHSVHGWSALPLPLPLLSRATLASLHHTLALAARPLRSLALNNCGLGDLEMGVIVSGAAWACALETLELRDNRLGDLSAGVLVRFLRRCSRLERLDVRDNQLTLSGAEAIASAVRTHPAMRSLLLGRFPSYAAAAIDAICASLQASETLVAVDVSTKQYASRCSEKISALLAPWAARKQVGERTRRSQQRRRLDADMARARCRSIVRRVAAGTVGDILQRWWQPQAEQSTSAVNH